MPITFNGATIQLRRDTAANWTTNNSTLASGEIGLETDTNKGKIGDGTTAWNSLAYVTNWGGASAPVLRTGSTIAFDAPAIYNSPTSPASSSVTLDLSGAVAGTEVVAYFNHSAEPTWPSGVTAVGTWNNSALNVVRFLYQDSDDISAVIVSDAAPSSSGGWTTVVKATATTRNSTTTLAADPELKYAMAADEKVSIRLKMYAVTVAAADFKYRLTGPASPVLIRGMVRVIQSSGTAPGGRILNAYDSSDQSLTAAADFTAFIDVEIYIENGSTAGDFALEWAQNTSNAGNTTVSRGAYIEHITSA